MVNKSKNTITCYRKQLKKFYVWLNDYGLPTEAKELTLIDAAQYRDYLLEQGLKPASVNVALAALETYGQWLKDEGYTLNNFAAGVRRVESLQNQRRNITQSERFRLVRVARAEGRDGIIIMVLLFAGLQANEIVNLKVDDIAISDKKACIVVRPEAARQKARIVPIPKTLAEPLAEYLIKKCINCEWVFSSQRGEQLTYAGLNKVVTCLGLKARIQGLTCNVLRNTYVLMLLEDGVSMDTVADIAGVSVGRIAGIKKSQLSGEEAMQAAVELLSFT